MEKIRANSPIEIFCGPLSDSMLEWLVEVELPVLTPSFTTTEPTYWGATPRVAKVWANMKSLLCDIHESHCLHQAFNRRIVAAPKGLPNRSWFNFPNPFITKQERGNERDKRRQKKTKKKSLSFLQYWRSMNQVSVFFWQFFASMPFFSSSFCTLRRKLPQGNTRKATEVGKRNKTQSFCLTPLEYHY